MGCFLILRAMIVRVIFAAHGLIVITTLSNGGETDDRPWYLAIALSGLLMETLITLVKNKGEEWQWFCPSSFFYLLTVVPAIWLNELRNNYKSEHGLREHDLHNETSLYLAIQSQSPNMPVVWVGDHDKFGWHLLGTSKVQQQLLVLVLIIARWIMPKGQLTWDQVSQLLLVYIGTAADIVDFYDAFNEPIVRRHYHLGAGILFVWSWSLIQFVLVVPPQQDEEMESTRQSLAHSDTSPIALSTPLMEAIHLYPYRWKNYLYSSQIFSILLGISLQDLPFFAVRLSLILLYELCSQSNFFFTSKNFLVILFMFYRLFVIVTDRRGEIKKYKKTEKQLARHLQYRLRSITPTTAFWYNSSRRSVSASPVEGCPIEDLPGRSLLHLQSPSRQTLNLRKESCDFLTSSILGAVSLQPPRCRRSVSNQSFIGSQHFYKSFTNSVITSNEEEEDKSSHCNQMTLTNVSSDLSSMNSLSVSTYNPCVQITPEPLIHSLADDKITQKRVVTHPAANEHRLSEELEELCSLATKYLQKEVNTTSKGLN